MYVFKRFSAYILPFENDLIRLREMENFSILRICFTKEKLKHS